MINLLFFFLNTSMSFASTCDTNSKITGFTTVKKSVDKSYFYKKPEDCKTLQKCDNKKKSYLIKDNFVQVAQVDKNFSCVIFRNFQGYGGKMTTGWLKSDDLNAIRTKLERSDLLSDWALMSCEAGDDCMMSISENEKNKLEINIISHLHEHPASSIVAQNISESENKISFEGSDSGVDKNNHFEILYNSQDQEPGTITLIGDDFYKGIYRK